jgi:hypothetical protein
VGFFIHVADPGFPEGPWPSVRRFGPFLTAEEASNQAVHDLSTGFLTEEAFLGVFDDENSQMKSFEADDELVAAHTQHGEFDADGMLKALAARDKKAKAAVVPSKLKPRAAAMRRKAHAQRLKDLQEQNDALEALLPEGVSMGDLMGAAKQLRATAASRAKEDTSE